MTSVLKKILSTTLSAIVLTVGIASTGAYAQSDAKTFNGNVCQPTYGTQSADISSHSDGVYNDASSYRFVTCPIARDNRGNINGLRHVWVYVSHSLSNRTYCTLSSRSASGSVLDSEQQNTTGIGWLTFYNINTSSINGNYSLVCLLAAKAKITHIQWDEFGPTDS